LSRIKRLTSDFSQLYVAMTLSCWLWRVDDRQTDWSGIDQWISGSMTATGS